MHRHLAYPESAFEVALPLISKHYHEQIGTASCTALTKAILPYLKRTHLPFDEAVLVIAMNYLQDGQRVETMLANPDAEEWQSVLSQIIAWATKHTLYPQDIEATGSPDLDAYDDIRKKLSSYNFEGPLDGWITVTVVRRLYRYWRSHSMLSAGGSGYKTRLQRITEQALPTPSMVFTHHYSLDTSDYDGTVLCEKLIAPEPSVEETAEANELGQIIRSAIAEYAAYRCDPSLGQIWHSIVDRRLRITEVADQLGLSIWQVYRRYESLKRMLQEDQRVNSWFDLPQSDTRVGRFTNSSQAA